MHVCSFHTTTSSPLAASGAPCGSVPRRPRDGITPEQRAETLAYITSRFQAHSRSKSQFGLKDGEPVIVVFGFNMISYYWRKSGIDEDGFLETYLHFDDFSKEARSEFETKVLTPLLEEWQERRN
jgi:hypothetical protein